MSYRNAAEAVTATSYRLPPKAFYRLEGGNGTKLRRVVDPKPKLLQSDLSVALSGFHGNLLPFSDPIGVYYLRSCRLPGAAKLSIRRNALPTEPRPTA